MTIVGNVSLNYNNTGAFQLRGVTNITGNFATYEWPSRDRSSTNLTSVILSDLVYVEWLNFENAASLSVFEAPNLANVGSLILSDVQINSVVVPSLVSAESLAFFGPFTKGISPWHFQ